MDEIIVFVNKIVKIIHECTKRYDGKPTKNYGDKFLLTWRLPKLADAVDLIKAEAQEESKIGDDDMIKPDFDNTPDKKNKEKKGGQMSAKVIPGLLDDTAKQENEAKSLLVHSPSKFVQPEQLDFNSLLGGGGDEDFFSGMT